MAFLWLINAYKWGVILAIHKSWDDPPRKGKHIMARNLVGEK